jgi:hypothetical protein
MWEEYSSFTSGMPLTLLFPLGLIITFVGVYFLNSSAVLDDDQLLVLPCPALASPALPCTLPCPALPCPALAFPALPCKLRSAAQIARKLRVAVDCRGSQAVPCEQLRVRCGLISIVRSHRERRCRWHTCAHS